MRMVSVYSEAGTAKVNVEEWDGEHYENHRERRYQPSGASLGRLADLVNRWRVCGLVWVRPFLGGCVGYVANEGEMWLCRQDK